MRGVPNTIVHNTHCHDRRSVMSQLHLMLELVPVVSAGSCGVRGLNQEAGGRHGREERAKAEQNQVQIVLISLKELLLVPEGGGDPEDEPKGGGGGD